uniref:Zinc finger CHCC-type domain-containing protein n=1 Tax=Lepisosteus oculatus TaxID=7918 RepID=W5MQW0_LEPOC
MLSLGLCGFPPHASISSSSQNITCLSCFFCMCSVMNWYPLQGYSVLHQLSAGLGYSSKVNENFAINLVAEEPVKEVESRVVSCDGGGGALGHPRVYINLLEDCLQETNLPTLTARLRVIDDYLETSQHNIISAA